MSRRYEAIELPRVSRAIAVGRPLARPRPTGVLRRGGRHDSLGRPERGDESHSPGSRWAHLSNPTTVDAASVTGVLWPFFGILELTRSTDRGRAGAGRSAEYDGSPKLAFLVGRPLLGGPGRADSSAGGRTGDRSSDGPETGAGPGSEDERSGGRRRPDDLEDAVGTPGRPRLRLRPIVARLGVNVADDHGTGRNHGGPTGSNPPRTPTLGAARPPRTVLRPLSSIPTAGSGERGPRTAQRGDRAAPVGADPRTSVAPEDGPASPVSPTRTSADAVPGSATPAVTTDGTTGGADETALSGGPPRMTYLDGEPSEFGSGGGPGLTGSRSLSDTDTAATDGRSNRAGRLGDASTGGLDSSGPTDRATPAERREFDDTTASERQTEQVRTLARALERPSEADRVVEPLYRAIERKYRIERERRGL